MHLTFLSVAGIKEGDSEKKVYIPLIAEWEKGGGRGSSTLQLFGHQVDDGRSQAFRALFCSEKERGGG